MDVMIQMLRVPKCDGPICLGTYITIAFTMILIFNTCLWLDLNYQLHKREHSGDLPLIQHNGSLEEIIEEITDPVLIIIVSIFSCFYQKLRSNTYHHGLGNLMLQSIASEQDFFPVEPAEIHDTKMSSEYIGHRCNSSNRETRMVADKVELNVKERNLGMPEVEA